VGSMHALDSMGGSNGVESDTLASTAHWPSRHAAGAGRSRWRLLGYACLLLTAARAHAQPRVGEPAPETIESTPRAALTRFFELTRQGKYVQAAALLELPEELDAERAPELAKRLKLVLDHHQYFDMTRVSAAIEGNTKDGLGSGMDELARLPIAGGLTAPVRLMRSGGNWRFSPATVQRVDEWYELLPNRFWMDRLPHALLRSGPYALMWAQWLALPLFMVVVWLLGMGGSRASRALLRPFVQRTRSGWDDALLERVASPLAFAFGLIAADLLLPLLGLYEHAEVFCHKAVRASLVAIFFWGLSRSIDMGGQLLSRSHWVRGAPATSTLLVFGSRLGKTVVAAFALVALFSELGYPVTSLLAGLGVGGIAVALSAQKSLENLIGAFSIAVDQPFREGDQVRVDGVQGTVELIGMRSTRIRTADRTLVSIPNGKLAEMRIETFAARDRMRLGFTFGLSYETTPSQLRTVLRRFEAQLSAHPRLWPQSASVRFVELAESALMLEASAAFATADADEFASIRQEMLLGLLQIVDDCGACFARPARTLLFASQAPLEAISGVMPRPASPALE
jgi:MscS family membrane protein